MIENDPIEAAAVLADEVAARLRKDWLKGKVSADTSIQSRELYATVKDLWKQHQGLP